MRSRGLVVVACAIGVALFAAAYLAPRTIGKAFEMDEGAVVAYAQRVLDGAVPHRDFLTFYGPGNLWAVAGAFAVFGESVGVERSVGLLYRVLGVLALFVLAHRLGGLVSALLAALVAVAVFDYELVWAYATYGALAFGLLGLAFACLGAGVEPGRRQVVLLFLAGLSGGVALLMRFDFVLAVLLGGLPLVAYVSRPARTWYAGGLGVGAVVYITHAAIVGPARVARTVSDLLATGPGRRLPIPGPRDFPGDLLALAIVLTALFLVLGVVLWRRDPRDLGARILLGTGLFNTALVPWAISRADVLHVYPLLLVPLSLVPAMFLYLARMVRLGSGARVVVVSVVVGVVLIGVIREGDLAPGRFKQLRDVRDGYRGFLDDDSGPAVRRVIARARELTSPGQSLFVGPQDLRRTNYGPTYMYFLLRDLRPASYYMEMNPGTANREGSGLADELRRADWLILTSEWDDWREPNESSKLGPSEPNEVVRDDFCLRFESGQYRLYERCDR